MSQVMIIGLDSFISTLGLAKDSTEPVVEKAALEAALMVRRKAQANVPRRTGILQRSIVAEPIDGGAMTSVQEKYGIYVEEGTGLYGPYARKIQGNPFLAWTDGPDSVVVRSTKGMRAQPFFAPAVEDTLPEVGSIFEKASSELVSIAVGGAA